MESLIAAPVSGSGQSVAHDAKVLPRPIEMHVDPDASRSCQRGAEDDRGELDVAFERERRCRS